MDHSKVFTGNMTKKHILQYSIAIMQELFQSITVSNTPQLEATLNSDHLQAINKDYQQFLVDLLQSILCRNHQDFEGTRLPPNNTPQ